MTGVEQAHEVTTTGTPQRLSRGWHATLAIVVTASFAGQLYLLSHGETDLSPTGAPGRDGRRWRVLRLDALLGIVITGLVFGLVLAGLVHPTGLGAWVNAGFHYFSPWWALAGWLLFGPRPRIGWPTVAWAFAWPIAWVGYTFIHGAVTGWYPYPFLNAHTHGYAVAVRNTGVVVLLGIVIALVLKALDGRLPAIRR